MLTGAFALRRRRLVTPDEICKSAADAAQVDGSLLLTMYVCRELRLRAEFSRDLAGCDKRAD